MNFLTIDAANAIYECGGGLHIYRHPVAHAGFYRLCYAINTFERALGEAADDEYWATFIRLLKRYRFHMLAAPLPFDWQDPRIPDLEQRLSHHVARCHAIYPQFASQAHKLFDMFRLIGRSSDNPLLDCFLQVWYAQPEEPSAILVKESRLIPATEAVIQSNQALAHKRVDVISPTQADYARCYQQLFVIGSVCWFPDHIFSAPRASTIHVISYRWLANRWRPEPLFAGTPDSLSYRSFFIDTIPGMQAADAEESEVLLEPKDILPIIDAKALSKRLSHTESVLNPYQEDVPARLFVLAGDMGVFVEAADQTKVLAINLDNDDGNEDHIQRIPFNELTSGMFILLRTEGGGDYIVEVADKLMGPKLAQRVRQSQIRWKSLLRKVVEQRGLFETCLDLIDLGSQLANETNVRNWMASRTIRPSKEDDFRAILRLVGLEAEFDAYWKDAKIILEAHQRAGFHIRKQLLRQVRVSDLQLLRKKDQIKFVLPEADGGSLTAFRIEYVDPDIVQVPISRLGELFPLE